MQKHRLISHRGNLSGANKSLENQPGYIENAMKEGFGVEFDLWSVDGQLFLGHDEPQYPIEQLWFKRLQTLRYELDDPILYTGPWVYVHAKNADAFNYLVNESWRFPFDYFWHQTDQYTLTRFGRIWAYPTSQLLPNSIWACPELAYSKEAINDIAATLSWNFSICTDHPLWYLSQRETK